MHLLAATPGAIEDGSDPVDPGQTPADLVVLSAADTELAALSEARAQMQAPPGLRLMNLAHLRHPMSVDLHLDQCASASRLVVARLLGGAGYWRYGFEQYAARLREAGVPVAFLPGDDKPDAELRQFSTVDESDYDALWAYLVEGGPENAAGFLSYAQAMLDGTDKPAPAKPLLKAGIYWPGDGIADLDTLRGHWTEGAPIVPFVFYRALLQGAGLHPVGRMVRSLLRRGLNPMPVFVASLKDPLSAATLTRLFQQAPPEVILDATAFAVATPEGQGGADPLRGPQANGAPVFQTVLAGSSEQAWEDGLSGLSARDIAMNVALPEVDGRILSRAISFKSEAFFDEATQCAIAAYRARGDRIEFTADLAASWARLRRTATGDRKVALILANYPNKDGRLANGVGLDTPAATTGVLRALANAGYATEAPPDARSLMDRLMAGPTNWLTDRADRAGGEILPLAEYRDAYGALPWNIRRQIEERWGQPEDDPFVAPLPSPPHGGRGAGGEGGFKLSIHRFGNAVVGFSRRGDTTLTRPRPTTPPTSYRPTTTLPSTYG